MVYKNISSKEELLIKFLELEEKHNQALAEMEVLKAENNKLYNENLLRSNNKTAQILDRISDGFYALDPEWVVTYMNKRAKDIFHKALGLSNFIGMNALEIFPHFTEAEEMFSQALSNQSSVHFTTISPISNRWYEINAYPSGDGLSVFFRDITEQKLVKEELDKTNTLMKNIIDGFNDGLFFVDKEWIFTYLSDQAREYFNRDDLIGKNIWEEYPKAVDTEIYYNYQRAMNEQISVQFEVLSPHLNKWSEIYVSPTNDGIIVYFRDITKKKKVKEHLKKPNQLMTSILDSITDCFYALDKEWRITYINKALARLFGLKPQKVIGKIVWEVFPILKETAFYNNYMEAMAKQKPVNFETYFPVISRWLEVRAYPSDDGLSVYFQDISERKQMEEKIHLNQMRLEGLLNIYKMSGSDIEILERFALEEMVRLTGSEIGLIGFVDDNEKLVNKIAYSNNVTELCKVNNKPLDFSVAKGGHWAEAIRQRKAIIINDFGEVPQNKDGLPLGHIPIHRLLSVPMFDGNKIVMQVVVANKKEEYDQSDLSQLNLFITGFWTIIQRKIAEEEKRKTQQKIHRLDSLNLIGQMAAGIGHEVRNPMTTVRGFLQMLGEKPRYKEHKSYFELMISELDRANSIISEFLSIARKNKRDESKSINLNSILEALLPLIQADAFNSHKNIQADLGEIPNLMLSEKEIRQLILNIVRNGLEAMEQGGILTIKTYAFGDEIILSVQDQGSGIDQSILDKLGTPFLTTKEKGTGLGLAVCYSIARRNNANIEVKTSSSGTNFFVKFKA